MRKSFLPLLLAGVALPLSAFAQDNSSGGQQQPPAASDTATPSGTASGGDMNDAGGAENKSAPDKTDRPTSSDAGSGDQSASNETFVTVPPTGAWRTSDLDGKSVYGANGENIGDISDVLVSEDGKVTAVLVGVGGFLGIGQKDVAVSMSALKFGPGKTQGLKTEEQKNAENAATAPAMGTGGAGGTGGMTGTGASSAAGGAGSSAITPSSSTAGSTATDAGAAGGQSADQNQEPVVGEDNLPDHIVLNVTRQQLEDAPAYQGDDDNSQGGGDNSNGNNSDGAAMSNGSGSSGNGEQPTSN